LAHAIFLPWVSGAGSVAVIEALKSYWGNEISVRSRWLRSLFVWLRAIVCPRISCWAVTPFGTLAKPEQRVQPMQNAG